MFRLIRIRSGSQPPVSIDGAARASGPAVRSDSRGSGECPDSPRLRHRRAEMPTGGERRYHHDQESRRPHFADHSIDQMRSFTAPMKSRNPVLHFVFARMGIGRGARLRPDQFEEARGETRTAASHLFNGGRFARADDLPE